MTEAETSARHLSGPAREARDWIVRLNSGEVDAAMLERFRLWRGHSAAHAEAFEYERRFWRELGGLAPVPVEVPARPRFRRRAVLAGGLALAGGAAVVGLLPQWQGDFTTGPGEIAEVALPDGTEALLNTDSAIALDFTGGARRVSLLRGEAEFRVTPDPAWPPLQVAALGGVTTAQDALFSINRADRNARVAVSAGQVRVTAGQGFDLGPAQQLLYGPDHSQPPISAIDPEVVFAWRKGWIIFEGRRFEEAVAELGRYLPERILMAPRVDKGLPVSASFRTSGAEDALRALAGTQGLTVRRVPNLVILLG